MAESSEFQECAVCRRTILRGEHTSEYIDGDGELVEVCALCKPRAETSGWVPAAFAATVSRHGPERRRVRVGSALRERFARLVEAEPAEEPPPAEPEPRSRRRPARRSTSSTRAARRARSRAWSAPWASRASPCGRRAPARR
jgi:hypothetical protein